MHYTKVISAFNNFIFNVKTSILQGLEEMEVVQVVLNHEIKFQNDKSLKMRKLELERYKDREIYTQLVQ